VEKSVAAYQVCV